MPAAGKTTVGKNLAKKLGLPFFDLDREIVKQAGMDIPAYFSAYGEDAFRHLEADMLRNYTKQYTAFVMACGGGTPCFYANIDFMNAQGITVYLYQPVTQLVARLAQAKAERPLVASIDNDNLVQYVENLLSKRSGYYLKAQLVINHTADINEKLMSLYSVL